MKDVVIKISFFNIRDFEQFKKEFEMEVVETVSERIINHQSAYFELNANAHWEKEDDQDLLVYQFNKLDKRDIPEKDIKDLLERIYEELCEHPLLQDLEFRMDFKYA